MKSMPKLVGLIVATAAFAAVGQGAASAAPQVTTGTAVAYDTGWD